MKIRLKTLVTVLLSCQLVLLPSIHCADAPSGLEQLEASLARDLKWVNYPPAPWVLPMEPQSADPVLDVAIVGSGMAGLAAAFGLLKEGVDNIALFDENPQGNEGPWLNFARMKVLRTHKSYMGPAMHVPSLTFHAWYNAVHGVDAWKQLKAIPTAVWMDYLVWYRQVLKLPVENDMHVLSLQPSGDLLELTLEQYGQVKSIKARKVVLATGRGGFGGFEIPEVVKKIPKQFYAHSGEKIDSSTLKDKRIAVIGCGASGFDAAAFALESGALKVDLLLRKRQVPNLNKFSEFSLPGITYGFYNLPDEMHFEFMRMAFENGIPPPKDALIRVQKAANFKVIANTPIDSLRIVKNEIMIDTWQGPKRYDYMLLGTGFSVDGSQRSELSAIFDKILLWKDVLPLTSTYPKLGRFPYLGSHFEFLEKVPGTAPYLKNIYCFNYGAAMSHGLIAADIPCISIGASRLSEGIAADFFVQDCQKYLKLIDETAEPIFNPDDFPFLKGIKGL